MKVIKNETVEEMLENSGELKYIDGWAYLGSKVTKTVPETMICFYPKDDSSNLFINGKEGLYAMNYLTVYVPADFVTKHADALEKGIKATLFALIEEDVEFFDVIPTNLFQDKKFLKSFIQEAQKIMKNSVSEVDDAKDKVSFIVDAIKEKRKALKAFKKELHMKKKIYRENNSAYLRKLRQIEAIINSLNSEVHKIDEQEAQENSQGAKKSMAKKNKQLNKQKVKVVKVKPKKAKKIVRKNKKKGKDIVIEK